MNFLQVSHAPGYQQPSGRRLDSVPVARCHLRSHGWVICGVALRATVSRTRSTKAPHTSGKAPTRKQAHCFSDQSFQTCNSNKQKLSVL